MTDRSKNDLGSGKTGFSHLIAAGRYSFAGIQVLAKESAARHEVLAFLALLAVLYFSNARFGDYLVVTILFLVLLSIEALNTSIEQIVDRVSPERSEFARTTKDLGSAAVFFTLCAAGIYVLAVLVRTLGWLDW